jgi:hypothetical protein
MQLLGIIAYGPKILYIFETHKKVVSFPKVLTKVSVKDEKNRKAKKQEAKGRRSRQKDVGEKTKRKVKARPRAKTWEEKRFSWLEASVFPTLAKRHQPPTTPCLYLASPAW